MTMIHYLLAASDVTAERETTLLDLLATAIPWLLILLFIWFFVFRSMRKQGKLQERYALHMDYAERHMDSVEKKLDRLIEVTEQRTR